MSKERILVNALSKIDKDMFYDYTGEYSHCTECVPRATVDKILDEWDTAKRNLYAAFGNQFIINKEISYIKEEKEIADDLNKFFLTRTYSALQDFIIHYCQCDTKNFWDHPLYEKLRHIIDNDNFYDNIYHGETFSIPIRNSNNNNLSVLCTHGMKLMKLIKKIHNKFTDLFSNLTAEQLEKDIVTYSQCLNEKTFKGQLCLSIHPLDFITASDNNSGWDSCMTYCGEGDYRRGIIEMMNSPIVVCAYLASSSLPYKVGNLEWNNKKWREFFIVRDDIISGIKGYPYWNKDLEKIVIEWLKELMEAYYKVSYGEIITFRPDRIENGHENFKFSTAHHAMYNDFYNSNTYQCCITDAFDYDVINYPGRASCIWCGEICDDTSFNTTSQVCCYRCGCNDDSYCDCCDERVPSDTLTEVDGSYWCEYCVEQYAGYSDVDYSYHNNEDIYEVMLASRNVRKGTYNYSFRFWNNNYGDNDFDEIPYPIYKDNDNDRFLVFIEDIMEIDQGQAISDWIYYFRGLLEHPNYFIEDKFKDCIKLDMVSEDEGLELIHEGKKVTA